MLIIDRFEDQMAVIEYGGRTFNIPRDLLPAEAKEGDVLEFSISVDVKTTEERKKKIKELMDEVIE